MQHLSDDYSTWLVDIKQRIGLAQQRAVLSVNYELISLYWQIGTEILKRQEAQGWGAKVIPPFLIESESRKTKALIIV